MRHKLDFYPTPSWATKQLLNHIKIDVDNESVLECCSGNDDITKVLREFGCVVHTNDIDLTRNSDYHYDARSVASYYESGANWVITNPPFNCAIDILKTAHANVPNIAMLLRLSFLEPTKDRQEFLINHPPNKVLVLPRISFTGDGKTDSVTCAWLVWDKSGDNYLKVIPRVTEKKEQ